MYNSLKEYINYLDSIGELTTIEEFTDPIYEITRLTDIESKKANGGKALLFKNTGTEFPVVTNIMGSEKRMNLVLGIKKWEEIDQKINVFFNELKKEHSGIQSKLKLIPKLAQAAKWFPKKFKGKAPCQEIVIDCNSKEVLSKLPILKCWPEDGGRFITFPLVHTIDKENGGRNLGMYRMQVFDEVTTGMHWHRHHTGARHYEQYKDGKMPIAVAIGGDPIYTYSATAPLPDGIDEYILAGFFRNKPVELTDCLTQPIQVPADCDFVIEGYIDTKEEKLYEGPFGDHTGFYSLADYYPAFHVTCLTHRKDAIYPATIVGIPPMEDKYIAMATEKIFIHPLKMTIAPEIEDLFIPEEGTGHNFAVVKINKTYPGQGQKIAYALWGAGQMMLTKFILVVSGDKVSDIRDYTQLNQAIKDNYHPERDTFITKGPLDILDHTSPICGFGGKMCIDATEKSVEELASENSELPIKRGTKPSNVFCFTKIAYIDVLLDRECDTYEALWLLGGNCDPLRDSYFENDSLVLDGRIKKNLEGFKRDWPNEVKF